MATDAPNPQPTDDATPAPPAAGPGVPVTLAARMARRMGRDATESIMSAQAVRAVEISRHINPARGRTGAQADTLVGLSLSGGGIRSATFALGVLQALRSLDVFKQIDYVSSVSGGGYINGWLQALSARGGLDAGLPLDRADVQERYEPRQVRFLRAYSNYLTPKLGLFSGDTWAAVGNSVRNLVLNLGVLSLSLIAPLYIPWLLTLGFWRTIPDNGDPVWPLLVAAVLLTITVTVSTLNMSQPLKDGTWNKPVGTQAATWKVLAFVVLPALLAAGVLSPLAWTWAKRDAFRTELLLPLAAAGGAFYGAIWFAGATAAYGAGRLRKMDANAAKPDWWRAGRALGVLVTSAFFAGMAGTFVAALASRGIAVRVTGEHAWLVWLLVFPACVLALLLAVTVHIGLSGRWLSDETREWWGRVGGVQLLITLLIVIVSALSLAGPHLWSWAVLGLDAHRESLNGVLAALWAAVTGAGVLAGRSSRTASGGGSLLERIGRIAPGVFVVGYLLVLATFLHNQIPHPRAPFGESAVSGIQWFGFDRVEESLHNLVIEAGQPESVRPGPLPRMPWYEPTLLLMAVLFTGLAVGLSRRVDLNEFSLHALYRNRLIRCYLGASNAKRSAHPFTGFDPRDDLPLAFDTFADAPTPIRPYPIFNVAMNLVGGRNLAWQQRKAASFILSPEFCGFEYRVDEDNEQERKGATVPPADATPAPGAGPTNGGNRPVMRSAYALTRDHGGDPRSLTLGLAVATSGAAASPNMGYHTSPTLSFLMTVFNVRLGWWLRNPRWAGHWSDDGPRLSLKELMSELLGMTTDDRPWVYLSDGGHFENLGIYELVRRRCRFIIACDAGQDGAVTFDDLGNAIEKCRADFGVNIEINLERLRPVGDSRFSAAHCAIGTIRYDQQYADDPPGTLLYLKSTLTGDEPADVLRYASSNPDFPHQSTADQFFDESQFESYRALGYHIACTTLMAAAEKDEMATMPAVELFTHLRQQWTVSAPIPPDAIRKYSTVLSDIWTTVRTTGALTFLDAQMFPQWTSFIVRGDLASAATITPEPPPVASHVNYWLPDSAESRRAGFYVCNEMLQLMEDVYVEFKLDEHYDHIDNRGWMNLFQHWAWSGMLSATWGMTGSMYDPRFQRFCKRRLGLELGQAYIFMETEFFLPTPSEWKGDGFDKKAWLAEWEHGGAQLNFFEVQLVDRFLSTSPDERRLQLMPIRVVVPSPRRDEHNLDFNVGYLIGHVDWQNRVFWLHHMRVQNHLRKMGIARQALGMITGATTDGGWGLQLRVVEPDANTTRGDNVALDEGQPTRSAALKLQRIIDSLH